MATQISWHAELYVKPGQLDAHRALTSEMVKTTQAETGALIYERFISEDRQVIHVFERYIDSTAAVKHLTEFGRMYSERFGKTVDRKRFTVFGMPSPELKELLDRFGATYCSPFAGFSRS